MFFNDSTERVVILLAIDSADDWSKEWEYELRNREMKAFKPDYRQNSELRKELEKIIQDTS